VLIRPLAQPVQRVVNQLTGRIGCEKRAGRRVEGKCAVGSGGYGPPAFVDQVMMEGAEQGRILKAGFAAVQPCSMCAVKEGRVGAPGEGAAAVNAASGRGGWRGNGAGAAADIQCLSIGPMATRPQ